MMLDQVMSRYVRLDQVISG